MRREGTGPQPPMWSYVPLEQGIPVDHPLRPLRALVDTILTELSPQFDAFYSKVGRPSDSSRTPAARAAAAGALYRPERAAADGATRLQPALSVVRGLGHPIWDATVFTKNRERLLGGDIARAFFERVRVQADRRGLLSDEHDDRSASPALSQGGPAGSEAALSGHVLMENRYGLAVDGCLTAADGYGERAAALEMVGPLAATRRIILGADKAYDTRDFVAALRGLQVTPHVAQKTSKRSSAIDRRTKRHAGYAVSQQKRKRIEEIFGWLKTIGLMRQTRFRGRRRIGWMFVFSLAVYNLVRIRNLDQCLT